MHFHREVLAVNRMFARAVEVILGELVDHPAQGECLGAGVIDLDGVTVVDSVRDVRVVRDAEFGGRKGGPQFFRYPGCRLGDVNWRLVSPFAAGRELRTECAPVRWTFGSFVMPLGRLRGEYCGPGARRRGGSGCRDWRDLTCQTATSNENKGNRCSGTGRDLSVIDGIRAGHFRLLF